MWPRVEFIWLPISPGIKYLYLALVTAGFLSELQRLCPQTHVGNESAHSRLELSPRCAHCKKYPPERVTSAGFKWRNVHDKCWIYYYVWLDKSACMEELIRCILSAKQPDSKALISQINRLYWILFGLLFLKILPLFTKNDSWSWNTWGWKRSNQHTLTLLKK